MPCEFWSSCKQLRVIYLCFMHKHFFCLSTNISITFLFTHLKSVSRSKYVLAICFQFELKPMLQPGIKPIYMNSRTCLSSTDVLMCLHILQGSIQFVKEGQIIFKPKINWKIRSLKKINKAENIAKVSSTYLRQCFLYPKLCIKHETERASWVTTTKQSS